MSSIQQCIAVSANSMMQEQHGQAQLNSFPVSTAVPCCPVAQQSGGVLSPALATQQTSAAVCVDNTIAGGIFQYVSCPHYLAEIIIYAGLMLISKGQLLTLLMLLWVVSRSPLCMHCLEKRRCCNCYSSLLKQAVSTSCSAGCS